MNRTIHRALTVLALSGALAIGTTAVAGAAEDVNAQRRALYQSQLEQNLGARSSADVSDQRKALYQSQLEQNLAAGSSAAQAAAEQARAGEREFAATAGQSAVERVRAGERNLGPAPVVTITAQPVPAATGRGLDTQAVLLLGLVAGAAATAGWTAHRRHAHRIVAA
jgi:hypothetical protein